MESSPYPAGRTHERRIIGQMLGRGVKSELQPRLFLLTDKRLEHTLPAHKRTLRQDAIVLPSFDETHGRRESAMNTDAWRPLV